MPDFIAAQSVVSRFIAQLKSHAKVCVGALLAIAYLGYFFVAAPPLGFTPNTTVTIPPGSSVQDVAQLLTEADVIKHELPLRVLFRVLGPSSPIQAGVYRFHDPQSVFTIATRLVQGEYGIPPIRITFFEGETVRVLAPRVAEVFPFVSEKEFFNKGKPYEGYLFPDTYFFSPSSDTDSILSAMRRNFENRTADLMDDIALSGRSLSDVIIVASLVEREARRIESKRMVAGILWNRLDKGMLLQVDATFGYIFDRDTYHPSLSDLKVDSPYNTYIYKGLPPGPISNPGYDSIEAAVRPTESKYLYYITGSDNFMHYATTYAGHQANIRKYLK